MKDREPLVSIIVPVYNSAKYLRELLNSFQKQTYTNYELILVDDGSRDKSFEIITEFAARDPRICGYQKGNSGAADTRNFGLRKAGGDFIWFVDADDFVESDSIATFVATALTHDVDVVLFDLDNYHEDIDSYLPNYAVNREYVPARCTFAANDIPNIYKQIVGFTVNKFYRADFLRKTALNFPSVAAHEDMPFTYLALSLARKIYYLDRVFYHYRRTNLASVSNTLEKDYTHMFQALALTRAGLWQYGIWQAYQKQFTSYFLHMCTWQCSQKNALAQIEFLDTLRTTWLPKFELLQLSAQDVYDASDFFVYQKALNLRKTAVYRAKIHRRLAKIRGLVKLVNFVRRVRGKLARFIKSRQIFRWFKARSPR